MLLTTTIFLEEITQDPKARMHWAHYWRNVVQCYLVVIEGWPENIPFVNLSTVSSALPDLEMLLNKWETGEIHWRDLEEDEYEKLRQEHCEKVSSGEVIEKRRRTRSDKGKKRNQPLDNSGHRRKMYKSAETVVSDDESDAPGNTATHEHTPTVNAPSGRITNPGPTPSTPPTIPSPFPEIRSPTPPAIPSLFLPHIRSPTPPAIPSLFLPEIRSPTPPAIPSLFPPDDDMFGMSNYLPAGSPGAGPSIGTRSSEFNFLEFMSFD